MSTIDQAAPAADPAKRVPGHVIYRRVLAERTSYALAAAGMAIGPQLDDSAWSYLASGGIGLGTLAWLYAKTKDPDQGLGVLTRAQRAIPFLSAAGTYVANLITPGFNWWEVVAPAAWASLMGWMAPLTRSAGLVLELSEHQAQHGAGPGELTYTEFLAAKWQQATGDGTRLVSVTPYRADRPDFEAVVVAQAGKAVPTFTEVQLAAAFDFPVGTVKIRPVQGSGPGRMRLVARPTSEDVEAVAEGIRGLWETAVAAPGKAAPGVDLIDYRAEPHRIVLLVASPPGKEIHLPHTAICSAFGIDDPSRLVIETDGIRQGVVSIYKTNPLMKVRKATVEDLTMDSKGRVTIGVCHDGKPARMRLWDPGQGALRGITAGVTGAGKSVLQNLILAAEKRSGVVSWVGDVQGGMSLPEAEGRVDWFAKGPVETLLMLTAAHAVMKYRERISNEMGRGDFALGRPWPLINITLDEINRLLSHPDEAMRKATAYLIADIQKTGRKVGIGIRLAVQSLHLKDLGDDDAIRQQGKVGALFLMRTASSSTKEMGLDGIAPAGFQMENIPARIYENGQIEALFSGQDDEDGESTAGMAYMFLDGRAKFMRTFFAEKVDGVYPDLIALYGDEPSNGLTEGEAKAAQAGAAIYGVRHTNPYADCDTLAQAFAGTDDSPPAASTPPPGDDGDSDSEEPVAPFSGPFSDIPFGLANDPGEEPGLQDQILDLLADGPMSLKDLREALPGFQPSSVSNACSQLKAKSLAKTLKRGVWQRADS
ncbi:winged helix-turn-helix transcriptional regulator [Streptomyces sp. SID8014]|uniref:winged helix-turn-helix domain-containing protein n=1 Tax=Streptomyces sp. SID8014 TaxID=2706097 RepID=UPI0013B891D2|nr:winged helix-turn-helix domain-containing protein [Streptomyces sp. SID8014]NEC15293.1 winged helix-turn-helix transcriptional regulator [Streptomyces sp. SID8014]